MSTVGVGPGYSVASARQERVWYHDAGVVGTSAEERSWRVHWDRHIDGERGPIALLMLSCSKCSTDGTRL